MKNNSKSGRVTKQLFRKIQNNGKMITFVAVYVVIGVFLLLNTQATTGNDLVVTDINMVPANPDVGQAVQLSATIKNQGSEATTLAKTPGIGFMIKDELVAWYRGINTKILPGRSIKVTANQGPNNGAWIATTGKHTLTVTADDLNVVTNELSETNNSRKLSFTVGNTGRIYPATANNSVSAGKKFKLEVRLDPGTEVEGYELKVNYDTEKLEVVNLDTSDSVYKTQINRQLNPGSIELARGVLGKKIDFDSTLATITFKALASSGGDAIQISGNAAAMGVYTDPSTQDALVTFE